MVGIIERLQACLRFDEENPTESESEKAIRAAILEIKKLRSAMTGWKDDVCTNLWKDGEYVEDIGEYFDKILSP